MKEEGFGGRRNMVRVLSFLLGWRMRKIGRCFLPPWGKNEEGLLDSFVETNLRFHSCRMRLKLRPQKDSNGTLCLGAHEVEENRWR